MGLQKAIGVGDAVRYRTQYFIERDPTVVKIFIIDENDYNIMLLAEEY